MRITLLSYCIIILFFSSHWNNRSSASEGAFSLMTVLSLPFSKAPVASLELPVLVHSRYSVCSLLLSLICIFTAPTKRVGSVPSYPPHLSPFPSWAPPLSYFLKVPMACKKSPRGSSNHFPASSRMSQTCSPGFASVALLLVTTRGLGSEGGDGSVRGGNTTRQKQTRLSLQSTSGLETMLHVGRTG